MVNEDRQQKINELKALRAELLAIKEAQEEGESGEGNAKNDALKSLRKEYTSELELNTQEKEGIDSVRQDIYKQYEKESEDNISDSQQKVLTRRR